MAERFKLGLKEPSYDSRDLAYAAYRTPLVAVPTEFGHYGKIVHGGWGVLGNDQYGDCFWAGQAHAEMQWTVEGDGTADVFSTPAVLSDYAACTGFDPQTGANDDGTDPRQGLNYHRNAGIIDANGTRHKLAAYTALEPGNDTELAEACYLFGAVGIGLSLPMSAQDQFPSGYWRVVPGSPVEGGHWVIVVGRWNGYLEVVSWGKRLHMTVAFYRKYANAAYGLLSSEILNGQGRSPEGYDWPTLKADLAAI